MGGIDVVSASAGSGKTYRLATALTEAIVSGDVRPEAVVATTFTRKAAAELRERVRARLLAAGKPQQAQRLAAARIGTVNSVCGALVTQYALELGLSPALNVLDDSASETLLKRALSTAASPAQRQQLNDCAERLENLDWERSVEQVLTLARSNAIRPDELAYSATQSIAGFCAQLERPYGSVDLDASLRDACIHVLEQADTTVDTTKKTREYVAQLRQAVDRLDAATGPSWKQWMKLSVEGPGKKTKSLAAAVQGVASRYPAHPRFHADIELGVRMVFEVAASAYVAFEEAKRYAGVIDFADQEALALRLLKMPSVRERLREETDLVMVDEFQDTSPMQLAIFFELAELSERSLWVGDQKQSIYGFRGTDPALMDAALETILGDEEPETLPKSYRSRPGLVRVTSHLFAEAFAQQGIPRSRTRLEPATDAEAAGLGPCVERWCLSGKKKGERIAALAAAVRGLLRDADCSVRDPVTREAVAVCPGDVAVLCFSNATCAAVAAELEALGVRAVRPRTGVLRTAEGHTARAALSLWVAPDDALARATLERLYNFGDEPSSWLDQVLEHGPGDAFAASELARQIRAARDGAPNAGPVEALQMAMVAIGLAEQCARWGDARQRIANLDAIGALAVAYAKSSESLGNACSAAGLLAYMGERDIADARAVVAGRDEGVVISTWHASKGLEWPVAILFELENNRAGDPFGVHIVGRDGGIKADDPLTGRWIRYWPWQPMPQYAESDFKTRLEASAEARSATRLANEEALRLLYVGWTRARDRLVLASKKGGLTEGILAHLHDDCGPLLSEPSEQGRPVRVRASWGGHDVEVVLRHGEPEDGVSAVAVPGRVAPCAGPCDTHVPAFVPPSTLAAPITTQTPPTAVQTMTVQRIGKWVNLRGKDDMNALGSAVHGFLAADRAAWSREQRLEVAEQLLDRWRALHLVGGDALVDASDSLRAWVRAQWPEAAWRREWPVMHRLRTGSVVSGTIDLFLETDAAAVVVDHKAVLVPMAELETKAREYAPQVAAYAEAVRQATGRGEVICCVHFPWNGVILQWPHRFSIST